MLRLAATLAFVASASAYQAAPLRQAQRQTCAASAALRTTPAQMLNLFGNNGMHGLLHIVG